MTRESIVALLMVIAVALGAGRTAALAEGELTVRIEAVDDSAGAGSAVITVLDPDGRPVVGLEASDFALIDAGRAVATQSVVSAEDASVGIAVVLAIDTSLSMQPVLDAARTGAGGVLDGLAPEDRAALISFSNEVATVQSLSADTTALTAGLDSLVADGPTALYDAVLRAVETARDAPLDRRVVILLTDGLDEGSSASRREAVNAAATSGVPIYAIGFGTETDAELLRDLAAATDGSVLLAPDAGAMLAAYEEFASVLRSQYIVAFNAAPAAVEVARTFEVTVSHDGVTASAARGYTSARAARPVATAVPEPAAEAAVVVPAVVATAENPTEEIPAASSDARPWLIPGAAAMGLVVLATGALLVARRRRAAVATVPARLSRGARTASGHAPAARSSASLYPLESSSRSERVVTEGDLLLLDDDDRCGTAPGAVYRTGPARLWWRDGKLMLHRRPAFGRQSEPSWATLETGDVIEVGADRFRVEIDLVPTESRTER